jgi:hypothetical protein
MRDCETNQLPSAVSEFHTDSEDDSTAKKTGVAHPQLGATPVKEAIGLPQNSNRPATWMILFKPLPPMVFACVI